VPYEKAFTEHSHYHRNAHLEESSFLVFCNHCDNPPCVRACPTKATFKRKDGIVAMDYHRCIGCRFCMAACPYGMRSFNWRDPRPFIDKTHYNKEFPTRMRGVVEKCNFCVERLAKGLKPACVEACGNTGGLTFGNLNDPHSEIRKVLESNYTIQRKPALGTHPSLFYII
jgi:molybdopterin-containing oxidoreductase family iron-sulfur binding subunit